LAAEQLKLTANDMKGFGLIDEIVPEPFGGAHWSYSEAAAILKEKIIAALKEMKDIDPAKRVENRIEKYSKMGFWNEA
jgi:acetyl-CoA carboxylase carboxyl transferase subunit alpha